MPEWLTGILLNFWMVVGEMSPYLLFGFFAAGVLSVVLSPEFVERHLGGRGVWPVIKAAAFGVPLPLCSCGVIPVAASIRKHGASKGATTGFLISTPQTGVDSILATFSLLGPVFAIYRPLAALVSGVLGGAIVSLTDGDGDAEAEANEKCEQSCCAAGVKRNAAVRILSHGFITLPRDIGRTLLLGLVMAALISAIVPEGYFAELVPPGPLQIIVLMLVGIPIYICATASIPVAAGLILAGVSPGAAFALLMTGPATNAATVVTIWKVIGKRACMIYLLSMMVAAFVGGLILDEIVSVEQVQSAMQHDKKMGAVKAVAAVAMLSILAVGAFYRPRRPASQELSRHGESIKLAIDGMTCEHCVASVTGELLACPGVQSVDVDLATGQAEVFGDDLDAELLCEVVEKLAYNVQVN